MPASLEHIHPGTPMGATLVADGATFRVWAPHARAVYASATSTTAADDASLLTRDEQGHWRGFVPGVRDRDRYMFYVVGDGSEGPKRDPYARELETPFPSDCMIRSCGLPLARERVRHPAVSGFRHLSTARRHVLHAEPAGQGRHVSGRGAQDSVSGRPRRHGDPAAADSGISDRVQPRIQRHRLLLARDGFRRRRRRAAFVYGGGQSTCSMHRGVHAIGSKTCAAR